MDNIQQRETLGLFLRFTSICQVRCGVLSSKDDVLTKENHQCLGNSYTLSIEKCTNHLIDSFRKVQDAYK
ncbi:unnamed protein product (macronuclear) [Paramecium tetraurelia]|uniref:Uncharacterized protein n=1 Tax=Paramecium tetraurelia TaxID=5888 RepID=A0BY97_PARTE|nr:uncharacterized protein GSPATT00033367001 [Paramecium tetraurelia]CAK63514.1 unnamed protein product [Paramecium tetraurelia]|eukprot:XP_001430912.1 hypothetical protein (macronuclear) [Paramecium tetraurelia strain d4-2]